MKLFIKNIPLFISLFYITHGYALDKVYTLESPNNKIKTVIYIGKEIKYDISYKGQTYIQSSIASMTLDNGMVIGRDCQPSFNAVKKANHILKPVYGITESIKENYNELLITTKQSFSIVFRVYNEGFAYRFITNIGGKIKVTSEQADFHFTDNYPVYFHPKLSESGYRLQNISDTIKPNYSSLPILIKPLKGPDILIHESDVLDYPCLSVTADDSQQNVLKGMHARYPKEVVQKGYNLFVKETERFIASTSGTRSFPWRLIAFADDDKDILANQLVYLLASDNKLSETSWIKPGKVSWDYWNGANLSGVPFQTGINTKTYKYFIDFASKNHIEYINLDEGWSDPYDLMKITPKINMPELVSYAKSKNVRIMLWCVWHTLDRQMIDALNQFEKWGIAGLKVDFMDRDDQIVVDFHERLLQEAAKRKMLINYHGAYHPTGLSRTYPNNINVEGVKGLEWDKFDVNGTSPDHDVMIPFIRMFAGGMDYTPGAMSNFNQKDWKQIFDRPMSQGTRCHQLAMYVVYYAPLQMLADAPTAYEKEPVVLNLLSMIPTTWDETIPIAGEAGKYVAVARRKGNDWYVGILSGWNQQKLSLPLNFLSNKKYVAQIFEDGINAERIGSDYTFSEMKITNKTILPVSVAKGGGWIAKITLANNDLMR